MSSGRKKRKVSASARGVKTSDLIGNLTQASGNGDIINLKNETFKKTLNLGRRVTSGDIKRGRAEVQSEADAFSQTVTKLDDDQIASLNVRFQQRAGEILQRNTFQGRSQLILTDRE
jgi:hypothetical protein